MCLYWLQTFRYQTFIQSLKAEPVSKPTWNSMIWTTQALQWEANCDRLALSTCRDMWSFQVHRTEPYDLAKVWGSFLSDPAFRQHPPPTPLWSIQGQDKPLLLPTGMSFILFWYKDTSKQKPFRREWIWFLLFSWSFSCHLPCRSRVTEDWVLNWRQCCPLRSCFPSCFRSVLKAWIKAACALGLCSVSDPANLFLLTRSCKPSLWPSTF